MCVSQQGKLAAFSIKVKSNKTKRKPIRVSTKDKNKCRPRRQKLANTNGQLTGIG